MKDLLTIPQSKRLHELEKIIKRGKQTFVQVGLALVEIRDGRLYKSDFNSFEDYCREKWGWSKPYCTQLITAARVVNQLPQQSAVAIATESQARELSKVEPEKRASVIELAGAKADAENRPMTARDIAEVADPEDKPHVVAGPMPVKAEPGGLISPPVMPAEHSPEDDRTAAVRNLVWWWRKAKKWEREEFCETVNLVLEPANPKPTKNGSFENWCAHQIACEAIEKRIGTLEGLRPDLPHLVPAAMLWTKLIKRLQSLSTKFSPN